MRFPILKVSAVRISVAQYLVKAKLQQFQLCRLRLTILLVWSEITLKLEKYEEFQRKIIALKDLKAHGAQVAIPQAIKLFKRK
jgi:hypothetical protein